MREGEIYQRNLFYLEFIILILVHVYYNIFRLDVTMDKS